MATVADGGDGRRVVWCTKQNGKRHPIRLGRVTQKQAEKFAGFVTELEACKRLGQLPDPATIAWLTSLSPKLHERLARTELVESRGDGPSENGTARGSLGHLIDIFPKSLTVKPQSLVAISQLLRNLEEYFGRDKPVAQITAGDADEFRSWLEEHGRKRRGRVQNDEPSKPLSLATVSRRCRSAAQVFEFAVRKKWCHDNPFAHVTGGISTNPDKDVYVPPGDIERVLSEEPDIEFRAILALARFAGIRPSDVLDATWSQVDWEANYLHVIAPKTRRSSTGGHRHVPMFPKARQPLAELFERVETGATYIFPHYRETSHANLTDRLTRGCHRVQIVPWVKPWNNLRASCENDWIELGFDIFRVARWMGHAADVALSHYNRVSKDRAHSPGDELLRNLLHPEAEAKSVAKSVAAKSGQSVSL